MTDTNIKLQCANLDLGSHVFDFSIDNEFFLSRDYDGFDSCQAKVNVKLDKEESMITIYLAITGNVSVECDRCLDLMDIPVEVREIIIAKYGVGESNDESIMFVSPEDEYIDISSFVYDLVIVSLPVRKIHPDDENGNSTCNLKQLECLKSYQKQDSIDPRWEVLNSLKDNN